TGETTGGSCGQCPFVAGYPCDRSGEAGRWQGVPCAPCPENKRRKWTANHKIDVGKMGGRRCNRKIKTKKHYCRWMWRYFTITPCIRQTDMWYGQKTAKGQNLRQTIGRSDKSFPAPLIFSQKQSGIL